MVAAYATPDVTAVVTWNPLVSTILAGGNAHEVFNSTQIPGEIIDIMMVNTETLKDNPDFGKALVGAWYEMMGIMSKDDDAGKGARTRDGDGLRHRSRRLRRAARDDADVLHPADAVAFDNEAPRWSRPCKFVAQFLFDHGILGDGGDQRRLRRHRVSRRQDLGDENNIKLRFDPSFMAMAAEGKL